VGHLLTYPSLSGAFYGVKLLGGRALSASLLCVIISHQFLRRIWFQEKINSFMTTS
jgi:hypothetical protein